MSFDQQANTLVTKAAWLKDGESYTEGWPQFTNHFISPVSALFQAQKSYLNGSLKTTQFQFTLQGEVNGQAISQEAVSDENGLVAFQRIFFDRAGEYTFTLREVAGNLPGVSYDSTTYQVLVKVSYHEADKALVLETTYKKDGSLHSGQLVFANTYSAPAPTPQQPEPTPPSPSYPVLEVPLQVTKVLKNGSLKAGAFTFQLKDAQGTVLAEAKNAADGTVTFPNRTFSKAVSNYLYTVHEVKGEDAKIVYDSTVYTLKVSTRAVDGKLEASIAVEKDGLPFTGAVEFTNLHKVPSTGDNIYKTLGLILGMAALLGAAYLIVRRHQGQGSN
ncbi:MAG: hypothetical protein GXZ04_01975 [Clostridiales bacterium]|nr:hypothetical protein [Clostridiales bacterium]